jgi:hypothetical protein
MPADPVHPDGEQRFRGDLVAYRTACPLVSWPGRVGQQGVSIRPSTTLSGPRSASQGWSTFLPHSERHRGVRPNRSVAL